jgi:hypothetical protein
MTCSSYPLLRRRAQDRIFDDAGLYCTTNSFAQLVHTGMDIDELKTLSDSWSWSRGRLSLLCLAAMMVWNENRLHSGVSVTRMAFRSCRSPQQISVIDSGVLLVVTPNAHCYGIDAHTRVVTDPERNSASICIKDYTTTQLAHILRMRPDDNSACYLQLW